MKSQIQKTSSKLLTLLESSNIKKMTSKRKTLVLLPAILLLFVAGSTTMDSAYGEITSNVNKYVFSYGETIKIEGIVYDYTRGYVDVSLLALGEDRRSNEYMIVDNERVKAVTIGNGDKAKYNVSFVMENAYLPGDYKILVTYGDDTKTINGILLIDSSPVRPIIASIDKNKVVHGDILTVKGVLTGYDNGDVKIKFAKLEGKSVLKGETVYSIKVTPSMDDDKQKVTFEAEIFIEASYEPGTYKVVATHPNRDVRVIMSGIQLSEVTPLLEVTPFFEVSSLSQEHEVESAQDLLDGLFPRTDRNFDNLSIMDIVYLIQDLLDELKIR